MLFIFVKHKKNTHNNVILPLQLHKCWMKGKERRKESGIKCGTTVPIKWIRASKTKSTKIQCLGHIDTTQIFYQKQKSSNRYRVSRARTLCVLVCVNALMRFHRASIVKNIVGVEMVCMCAFWPFFYSRLQSKLETVHKWSAFYLFWYRRLYMFVLASHWAAAAFR